MCTVSWLPLEDGYTVCFNRDERHTRMPALPPAVRQDGDARYLAPLDGEFGGTWLATNEFGITLCILNRYRVPGYAPPVQPVSRGLLVLELAGMATARNAVAALENRPLNRVQPFSLVALEPGQAVRVVAWDGQALTECTHRSPGLILTSSSVTEPEVEAVRRTVFAALERVTPESLVELHRSHLPERGRCSVCMHREDAETQSFSQVTVAPDRVTLLHVPDAPCRGTALPPLELLRRNAPCPAPS